MKKTLILILLASSVALRLHAETTTNSEIEFVEYSNVHHVGFFRDANGKIGLMSSEKKIIIEPTFSFVSNIHEDGTFWVNIGGKEYAPQKEVREQISNYSKKHSQKETMKYKERLYDMYAPLIDFEGIRVTGGNFGYCNVSGNTFVPVSFSYVSSKPSAEMIAVRKGLLKMGYYNTAGQEVIPPKYFSASEFVHGYGIIVEGLKKKWVIDKTGKQITPVDANSYVIFSEDIIGLYPDKDKGERVTLLDGNGQRITDEAYSKVSSYAEDKIACVRVSTGKTAFIQKDGKQITDFKYDICYPFDGNVAIVGINISEKKHLFGLINQNGEELTELVYEDMLFKSDSTFTVIKNGLYGLIDMEGHQLIPTEYSHMGLYKYGSVCVKKDGHSGFLDKNGNELLPLEWDDAVSVDGNELYVVCKNGKWGALSPTDNSIVVPLELESHEHVSEIIGKEYQRNGCQPISASTVRAFRISKSNEEKRISINEHFPEEMWNY